MNFGAAALGRYPPGKAAGEKPPEPPIAKKKDKNFPGGY
jgi:hypothetical protein